MGIYSTVLSTSTATTTNNLWYTTSSPAVYYNDPLVFRYEPAYKVPPEILANEGAKPEAELAWLERRVAEICWDPA